MRELLYIPSGNICKFWMGEDNDNMFPTHSLEEFENTVFYVDGININDHLNLLVEEINHHQLNDLVKLYHMNPPAITADFKVIET